MKTFDISIAGGHSKSEHILMAEFIEKVLRSRSYSRLQNQPVSFQLDRFHAVPLFSDRIVTAESFEPETFRRPNMIETMCSYVVIKPSDAKMADATIKRLTADYWHEAEKAFCSINQVNRINYGLFFATYKNVVIGLIEGTEARHDDSAKPTAVRVLRSFRSLLSGGASGAAGRGLLPYQINREMTNKWTSGSSQFWPDLAGNPVGAMLRVNFLGPLRSEQFARFAELQVGLDEHTIAVQMVMHGLSTHLGSQPVKYNFEVDEFGGFGMDWISDVRLRDFVNRMR